MYKDKIKYTGILIAVSLILSSAPLPVTADYSQAAAANYIKSRPLDEWSVMALASTNSLDGVNLDFLKADPGDKPTDIEKRVLAIAAAGADPETFGQVNLIQKLVSNFNGTEINSSLASNLLNDDIFGLLALAAANKNLEIRNQLANFIKQNQNADGGWSYAYKGADSDSNDTAMAIMALVANGEDAGSTVINNAFNYLAATKTATGYSFDAISGFGPDSASTSWVISAFIAANRTVPGSAVDYLKSLQLSDGSFAWQAGASGSALMTAYALIALNNDFYPVRPASGGGGGSGSGCNLSVAIHATKTYLLVGEVSYLEAVGFVNPVTWALSDPAKAILLNSRVNTGKNTAEVTGANAGSVTVTAVADNCTAQITITITISAGSGTTPQFQVWIKGQSQTIFQGPLNFNQFSLTDAAGQTHSFSQPAAIGTVSEAARLSNFTYVIRNTSLGLFVECIANICPSGTSGWLYAVNGTKPNIGSAQYILSSGDKVIWFFGGPNDPVPSWPTATSNTSQAVSLSARIIAPPPPPAPPPVIIFGVDTSSVNFGDLQAGQTSQAKPVRLINSGTVNLRITSTLQNADSLYQQGLFLDNTIWSSFGADLDANFAKTVNLILQVPSNYSATGIRTGTLIFWASPK